MCWKLSIPGIGTEVRRRRNLGEEWRGYFRRFVVVCR
ncbi:hypothetical protein T03_11261 [Trichinella britovi]|uniref:Uncharacterized protein n=1 Tax=Trichinella britovi TaxID=45882 RepID=A0A0V0YUG5_TRIBR|nr:hypothetical protein T03_11261 [Trichinella britovi]